MLIVDTHAHIIVPQILREAAPAEAWRPRVYRENGQQIVEFGGRQIKSAVREFVDIEAILAEQDKAGVDHILLCPWVSLLRYEASPDEGLLVCRLYNDALARLASDHASRVSALGMIPLQDPELAARELETVMRMPGLYGVEIAASVNVGALVFIHPTTRGFDQPVFNDYYLWNTVGNPLETTITAAHMIMSGVVERYPKLKVLLAHGGGAVLSLRGRLRHSHSFHPQAKARLNESPEDSLKRFYFDTVTHDANLLRALVEYADADHVLLGSDYPFDMGVERPAEMVRTLGLSRKGETRILGGNISRLLGWEEKAHE
jgi:aminocarboxymuconate-semialdehyde decarboxylase